MLWFTVCARIKCIYFSNCLLCYYLFAPKENSIKTNQEMGSAGRGLVHFLCTALSAHPFSMTLNKSKLSRQWATVRRGLVVLVPPSLTSDAHSTKQFNIWQNLRSWQDCAHYGLDGFCWIKVCPSIWKSLRYPFFEGRKQLQLFQGDLMHTIFTLTSQSSVAQWLTEEATIVHGKQ